MSGKPIDICIHITIAPASSTCIIWTAERDISRDISVISVFLHTSEQG